MLSIIGKERGLQVDKAEYNRRRFKTGCIAPCNSVTTTLGAHTPPAAGRLAVAIRANSGTDQARDRLHAGCNAVIRSACRLADGWVSGVRPKHAVVASVHKDSLRLRRVPLNALHLAYTALGQRGR